MAIKTITETVTRSISICDRCGGTERIGYGAGGYCEACGRLVCGKCGVPDPDEPGDYPAHWCNECWDTGKPYRERIAVLKEQIEAARDEWNKLCKKGI